MVTVKPFGIPPPEYALPDATRIGGVRLQVSDIARSVAYYEEVIGLRVIAAGATSALGPQGDDCALITLETSPGVKSVRRGMFGLFHFALLLPERAALGQFAAHLARLRVRVGEADHLVSESLYLWDPDGLGIEVYADRPRSAWRTSGRELVMTTEPLDVESVMAAGGGREWNGMPPGTTMGHVHLSVGSLKEAESFYHRALGFDKTVWDYPGALFLAAGGYHHHLGTNTWSAGPSPAPDEAQLIEWELVVPAAEDITLAARSLRAAGYTAATAPDSVIVGDPWGTRVRVRASA